MMIINRNIPIKSKDITLKIDELFQSNDINRILIYVHGGPGYANKNALNETLFKKIIKSSPKTKIVSWDQRGAGNIFTIWDFFKKFNIDAYVHDLHEVVTYMRKKYNKSIYLLGHSFGTIVCAKYLTTTNNIKGYVGVAQVVNGLEAEDNLYNYIISNINRSNKNVTKKIENLGRPPHTKILTLRYLKESRKLLYFIENRNDSKSSDSTLNFGVKGIKFIQYYFGFINSLFKLWSQCLSTNIEDFEFIQCNTLFVSGALDSVCPYSLIDRYIENNQCSFDYRHITYQSHGHRSHIDNSSEFVNDIKLFFLKNEKELG